MRVPATQGDETLLSLSPSSTLWRTRTRALHCLRYSVAAMLLAPDGRKGGAARLLAGTTLRYRRGLLPIRPPVSDLTQLPLRLLLAPARSALQGPSPWDTQTTTLSSVPSRPRAWRLDLWSGACPCQWEGERAAAVVRAMRRPRAPVPASTGTATRWPEVWRTAAPPWRRMHTLPCIPGIVQMLTQPVRTCTLRNASNTYRTSALPVMLTLAMVHVCIGRTAAQGPRTPS